MSLDRRNYRQVVELAQKAGVSEIVGRIVNDLKDEAEPYQKMETITKVVAMLGASDNDERLEAVSSTALSILSRSRPREIKSCSMVSARSSMLSAFVSSHISHRSSLPFSSGSTTRARRSAASRRSHDQAGCVVIKQCGEDQLLSKLGLVLFEQLGEKYPDTLNSIIAAEGAIANVVGMTQMNPPVKDLREFIFILPSRQLLILLFIVPRMTPILRNRHEKVWEASINLIGRIGEYQSIMPFHRS
jgi:splicing factor 3B subunit 1